MVRTPLGSSVPGDDLLNSTYLYLPLFDQDNLQEVKIYLTSDAYEVSSDVVSASETQMLTIRSGGEPIFEALKLLPTEIVASERPMTDVKRVLKLCRLLEQDSIDSAASRGAIEGMLTLLEAEYSHRAQSPDFPQDGRNRAANCG
jgi:hypothetical protein